MTPAQEKFSRWLEKRAGAPVYDDKDFVGPPAPPPSPPPPPVASPALPRVPPVKFSTAPQKPSFILHNAAVMGVRG